MGKYQEVEAKFPLLNKDDVEKAIKRLGLLQKSSDEIQRDTYYTPFHKNFLDNEIVSEWFRVRETKSMCSVNFKQFLPIGAKIQNQCKEFETEISDIHALKNILNLLDFKKIIAVNKVRNSWIMDNVEISIDVVEGIGEFIELEALDNLKQEEINNMQSHFMEVLKIINAEVGPRNREGYPYMMLNKQGER